MNPINEKAERNEALYQMRMKGATYREIADHFDICLSRARQCSDRMLRLRREKNES